MGYYSDPERALLEIAFNTVVVLLLSGRDQRPAETPSDWVTTSTPVSARFTVAISSASPAIFRAWGGLLRTDRARARTECPASRPFNKTGFAETSMECAHQISRLVVGSPV
jgi:hypothetical protein